MGISHYICYGMTKKGDIIFHIEGLSGGEKLTLDTFDISDLKDLLGIVNDLLKVDRIGVEYPVTYRQEEGSVKAIFSAPLELVAKLSALLALTLSPAGLDALNETTAKAFENMQDFSRKKGFDINISTSFDSNTLSVTPETNLRRSSNLFADAELYLYGKILSYGGKNLGSICFDTGNETYHIKADTSLMEGWEENHYRREYAIRVNAQQNVITGEIVKGSMMLIEIVDYSRKINADYLIKKIRQATPHWDGVDADEYIREIREGAYV